MGASKKAGIARFPMTGMSNPVESSRNLVGYRFSINDSFIDINNKNKNQRLSEATAI